MPSCVASFARMLMRLFYEPSVVGTSPACRQASGDLFSHTTSTVCVIAHTTNVGEQGGVRVRPPNAARRLPLCLTACQYPPRMIYPSVSCSFTFQYLAAFLLLIHIVCLVPCVLPVLPVSGPGSIFAIAELLRRWPRPCPRSSSPSSTSPFAWAGRLLSYCGLGRFAQ